MPSGADAGAEALAEAKEARVLAREERDIHAGGVWGEIARHRREGLRAYVPRAPCEVRLEVEDVLERVPLLVVDLRVQTEQKRSTRAGGQRTELLEDAAGERVHDEERRVNGVDGLLHERAKGARLLSTRDGPCVHVEESREGRLALREEHGRSRAPTLERFRERARAYGVAAAAAERVQEDAAVNVQLSSSGNSG